MQNHSYEIDFDLHENETACRTHFIWKVWHLDSFWNGGTRELGNCLLPFLFWKLSITYHRQLSCHNRLLRGFRSSRGRSSTPHLLWSTQSPGCSYKSHLDDRNTSQYVRLQKSSMLLILLCLKYWGTSSNKTKATDNSLQHFQDLDQLFIT